MKCVQRGATKRWRRDDLIALEEVERHGENRGVRYLTTTAGSAGS
jgi:hypothetical protein